jgi:hypothetical protein
MSVREVTLTALRFQFGAAGIEATWLNKPDPGLRQRHPGAARDRTTGDGPFPQQPLLRARACFRPMSRRRERHRTPRPEAHVSDAERARGFLSRRIAG